MKISLSWLRELVDARLDADDLARRMTLSGLEIEGRAPFAPISGVVVAKVVGKRPHPEAAKLTLVDVEIGDGKGKTQVVCGAPNVPAAGGLVLWARPGATLPNGVTLAEKAVRGIVSPGMLCAEDELGLGSSHEGILIIDERDGLAPGDDFAAKLGLPDEIWEVNVTPNRPDCLGHVGVAREVAALVGGTLKLPAAPKLDGGGKAPRVEVLDGEGCPRYAALVLDGVTVRPSPLAVRLRLAALGVRPISNVVDATNLMMLLYSQPLHAFDLDKLRGGGVIVRRAKKGETIETLDGQTRTLEPDDVAICDDGGPVAVGGVMGGAGSEVSDGSKRLLLESACFAPGRVRRTAKRLGLHTEAAHRFERGTDPSAPAEVVKQLARLILELAGGKVQSPLVDVYPKPVAPATVTLRPERTRALLGVDVAPEAQVRLLGSIGVAAKRAGGKIEAMVPTWRPDLTREVDLIEEIARLHGYDQVPATLPRMVEAPGPMRAPAEQLNDAVRDALRGLGLDEVVTYGFVGPAQLATVDPGREPVRVVNPLREEQSVMRTSLVPSLALALQRNLSRGNADVRIFEIGAVFLPRAGAELPDERWHAAGVLYGRREGWLKPGAALDFFDAKGVVEELLAALGHVGSYAPSDRAWLHPGAQAAVHVGDTLVGFVGELHPKTLRALGVEAAAGAKPLAFELDLAALPPAAPVTAAELPRFPSVTRDLSFFIDEGVAAAKIRAAIAAIQSPLCIDVRVLEDYREPGKVPAGKKGMLWTFTYRAPDRTLTDAEVQKLHDELVAGLTRTLAFDRR